jgi:hypothetical protein
VTAKTLRPVLTAQIDRNSYLMTDGAGTSKAIGGEFAGHGSVNHSIEDYFAAASGIPIPWRTTSRS